MALCVLAIKAGGFLAVGGGVSLLLFTTALLARVLTMDD
jgi:hypothetical protein